VARLDASRSLKRQVLRRYAHTCAVCGQKSELTADVAHLFEDATTRLPRADTLIVLCSTCNQAEARASGRTKPPLSELFTPDEVAVRARRAYREGRYSTAYQGQRLAAYLYGLQGSSSRAVACLVDAVSAIRPIRWGDFIAGTLFEVERLCRPGHVGLVQRWLCLERVALVLYDYRRWRESREVQQASAALRSKIGGDRRYPVRSEVRPRQLLPALGHD